MPLITALGRQRQADFWGLRPAWSTYQVPGQPRLHSETLSEREGGEKKSEPLRGRSHNLDPRSTDTLLQFVPRFRDKYMPQVSKGIRL